MMSVLRRRRCETPVVTPCVESLSASTTSMLPAVRTGTSPNSRTTAAASATVNARTQRSTRNGSSRFTSWKLTMPLSAATPQTARRIASVAPAATMSSVSPPRSRAICHRLAPSAWRTASSRRRPADTASSRFATFAHAISSTSATAHSSATSTGLGPAARRADKGHTVVLQPLSGTGRIWRRCQRWPGSRSRRRRRGPCAPTWRGGRWSTSKARTAGSTAAARSVGSMTSGR